MFDGLFINKFVFALGLGYQEAAIDFNISATPGMDPSPNILSELIYDPLANTNYCIDAGYMTLVGKNAAIGGSLSIASSFRSKGEAYDHDFEGDDRTERFSLSKSSLDESDYTQSSLEIFLKSRWFNRTGHYYSFAIGFQNTEYDLVMTDGIQLEPIQEPIPGLNSSYSPNFKSTYISYTTEHKLGSGFLSINATNLWTRFKATADWNLREEFVHPRSFIHTGDGDGYQFSLTYSYPISKHLDLYSTATYRKVKIENGYDQIFLVDGQSFVTTLNEVNEDVKSLRVGLTAHF